MTTHITRTDRGARIELPDGSTWLVIEDIHGRAWRYRAGDGHYHTYAPSVDLAVRSLVWDQSDVVWH